MSGSHFKTSALGAFALAASLAGTHLVEPSVASADVSVGIEVAPEITAEDPEEVTVATEPPDPVYEERMDMPGPGYYWVGGYWGWRGSDWGWYPGRWLRPPEGRVYIEPYYERVGPNVVFVRGYWGRPDAPRRYYGGERIRFVAPGRPADFRRGEPPRFERRGGVPIGTRPPGFYERASGPVRPLPRAPAPAYRAAPREAPLQHSEPGREPGREVGGHEHAPPQRVAPHQAPMPHYGPAPHGAPGGRPGPPRRQ